MKNLLTSLLLTTLIASSLAAQTRTGDASTNEQTLRAHVRFLADDLLEGRAPVSRGGTLATKYIAAQFERLGLRPAGASKDFFQPVRLFAGKADPATTLTVRGADGKTETFSFGTEFVAFSNRQSVTSDKGAFDVPVDSELVFVGYGVDAPEQKWSDYKGAASDYKDKILVMLVNDPPATAQEPNLFGGRALTYYGRWTYKLEEAARRGARGAILLHTDESAGYGWNVVRTSWGGTRYDIARGGEDKSPYLDLRAWVTNNAAKRMFALAGMDVDEMRRRATARDFAPVKLNLRAISDIKTEYEISTSPNVVAVLEGSDPKLKNEYVAYTAHWDHLGVGEPDKRGDSIYNGAVDNASGVASVLAIAESLARLSPAERPKRSVLFLITTAEEQGLLGAEYFVANPTVPLASIAANINLDGLSFLGRTADFVPLGAERSTMNMTVAQVAGRHNLRVVADTRPEQGSFYRSDHFPLAKAGIPAVSLRVGTQFVGRPATWGDEQFKLYNQNNYHQPSDEYSEQADFSGVVQLTDFALALGRDLTNLTEAPRYNPTDEFARARR